MSIKEISVILILILFSCKEEVKNKTVTLDELSGVETSNEPTDTLPKEEKKLTWDSIPPRLAGFFQVQNTPLDQLSRIENELFLDRFQAKQKAKWKQQVNSDSTCYFYYQFKDSVHTKNAFLNWMDCFGESCQTISLLPEAKQRVRKGGHLIWVSEKEIIYATGNRIPKEQEWIDFQLSEREKETKKGRILFVGYQKPNGKWSWLSTEELAKRNEK